MKNFLVFFFIFGIVFLSPAFALSAPSVSSSSHPNQESWYNDGTIVLSWSSEGATTYSYILDSSPDTIPSAAPVATATARFLNKQEGEYYFHIKAVNNSEQSDTIHFRIRIDSTGPSRPDNITGEALDDGTIKISWEPSADLGSGVASYKVYRSVLRQIRKGEILVDFTPWDSNKIVIFLGNTSETNFIDANLEDGRNYHYRLQPIDRAENKGTLSSTASVKSKSFCDTTFDFSLILGEDDFLELTVYANDSNIKYAKVFLVHPDSEEELLVQSPAQERASVDVNKSFAGLPEGRYLFKVTAQDPEGDACDGEDELFIDKKIPVVSFTAPSTVSRLQETVQVKVEVSDPAPSSGIEKVEFYADIDGFKKIGEIFPSDENGNAFVFSWDTLSVENGRIILKAKAYDNSGNFGEKTEVFTVLNTIDLKKDINRLYLDAEEIKSGLNSSKEILSYFNVDFSSIDSLEQEADESISESKRVYDLGIDFEKSKKLASSGVQLLNAAKSRIKIEKKPPISYTFKKSELNKIYSKAGLASELITESVKYISDFGYSRKLNLYKITDGNNSNYFGLIEITLFNNSADAKKVKLIEQIPKKFASTAPEISSKTELIWLESDPQFYAEIELAPNKATVFKYMLSNPVALSDLNSVSSAFAEFESPSAIVSPERTLKEGVFNKQFAFLNFDSLKALGKKIITLNGAISTSLGLIIFGGTALVLVGGILLLAAVLAVYFLFFRKKRAGMR